MKFEVQMNGVQRTVQIEAEAPRSFRAQIDGRADTVDAIETGPDTYSILLAGRSFEARVSHEGPGENDLLVRCAGRDFRIQARDPRSWRAGARSALQVSGPQRVLAPMPGKVVRLLVAAGDTVEAGQGLLVVEAMKMQNEVRAPKGGRIERVLVTEGQAVRTQEALVIIS